jgi:uncharacterized protein YbjT (DUF2867 family)
MRVVIAGGHGQIALVLERLLAERGDTAVGLIRNPDQADDLRAAGATAVVLDLEQASVDDVAAALDGADAAVFAAGAGPGSGVARKDTVDRAAAVLFADAAVRAGVRRYIQVSAMGLERADAPGMDPVFAVYLRAKAAADDALRTRDLDWTIVRPGRLTDEPPAGLVRLAPPPLPGGAIPRADVAAVLLALLDSAGGVRRTFDLVAGDTPVGEIRTD